MRATHTLVVLITGVSGSGKTTLGQALASRLGWPFMDADSFHPQANIDKMSRGEPLTDEDRQPWLDAIRGRIERSLHERLPVVLTCSALKRRYRDQLIHAYEPVLLVYLRAGRDLLTRRLQDRPGHFFKTSLLQSQLDALEEPSPDEALILDAGQPVEVIVDQVIQAVGTDARRSD
ncbi:MAG: AAA family ATPase [Phycisphaera sp.]|nr:AAA family ATPase [Phycisphaera sp.]